MRRGGHLREVVATGANNMKLFAWQSLHLCSAETSPWDQTVVKSLIGIFLSKITWNKK